MNNGKNSKYKTKWLLSVKNKMPIHQNKNLHFLNATYRDNIKFHKSFSLKNDIASDRVINY